MVVVAACAEKSRVPMLSGNVMLIVTDFVVFFAMLPRAQVTLVPEAVQPEVIVPTVPIVYTPGEVFVTGSWMTTEALAAVAVPTFLTFTFTAPDW